MNLSNIAKRNILRNLEQYVLYISPMVLSVVIYFTFVSLEYNQQLINSTITKGKIEPAFSAASIILILFAAIFVWYSNSFFIRKRKKEIGLYALFGLSNKKIGKLLFFENIFIGIVALCIGMAIGMLMSKLFLMMMIKLMGFHFVATFSISSMAFVKTIIVFMLIIVITSIYNYQIVFQFTLSELFKANQKTESKPKSPIFTAALSLILLGIGYWIFLLPSNSPFWIDHGGSNILIGLFSIIVGTYFFIRFFVTFLLQILQRNKSFLYKGIHLISLTHLLYRIKGNIRILTVISLLSTVTLLAIGATSSMYFNTKKIAQMTLPMSFMFSSQGTAVDNQIMQLISNDSSHPILFHKKVEYLPITQQSTEETRYPSDYPVFLLSESTFLEIAKKLGKQEKKGLKQNEAIVFNDGNLDANSDPYTGRHFQMPDQSVVTVASYKPYSLFNQGLMGLTFVVNDQQYSTIAQRVQPKVMQVFKVKNDQTTESLSSKIEKIVYKQTGDPNDVIFSSFYQQYQYGLQTYAILIFIGGFLGIVFLIATGSMIYYKHLTEAIADRNRYEIMKKLGIGKKKIRQAISRQVMFIFSLPFLIGIVHSSIIITCLSRFIQLNMLAPFLTCSCLYLVIYMLYYLLTVHKYYKIVIS